MAHTIHCYIVAVQPPPPWLSMTLSPLSVTFYSFVNSTNISWLHSAVMGQNRRGPEHSLNRPGVSAFAGSLASTAPIQSRSGEWAHNSWLATSISPSWNGFCQHWAAVHSHGQAVFSLVSQYQSWNTGRSPQSSPHSVCPQQGCRIFWEMYL